MKRLAIPIVLLLAVTASRAADLPEIDALTMERVRNIYTSHIRELVHHYW